MTDKAKTVLPDPENPVILPPDTSPSSAQHRTFLQNHGGVRALLNTGALAVALGGAACTPIQSGLQGPHPNVASITPIQKKEYHVEKDGEQHKKKHKEPHNEIGGVEVEPGKVVVTVPVEESPKVARPFEHLELIPVIVGKHKDLDQDGKVEVVIEAEPHIAFNVGDKKLMAFGGSGQAGLVINLNSYLQAGLLLQSTVDYMRNESGREGVKTFTTADLQLKIETPSPYFTIKPAFGGGVLTEPFHEEEEEGHHSSTPLVEPFVETKLTFVFGKFITIAPYYLRTLETDGNNGGIRISGIIPWKK